MEAMKYVKDIRRLFQEMNSEYATITELDSVKGALEQKLSTEIVMLRMIGGLADKVWEDNGEHFKSLDNSHLSSLSDMVFEMMRVLAVSGSQYMRYKKLPPVPSLYEVGYSSESIEFSEPLSEVFGESISEQGSGLGVIYPGNNNRNKDFVLVDR